MTSDHKQNDDKLLLTIKGFGRVDLPQHAVYIYISIRQRAILCQDTSLKFSIKVNQFIHVRSKAQPAPSLSVFVAVVLPVQTSKVIAE